MCASAECRRDGQLPEEAHAHVHTADCHDPACTDPQCVGTVRRRHWVSAGDIVWDPAQFSHLFGCMFWGVPVENLGLLHYRL